MAIIAILHMWLVRNNTGRFLTVFEKGRTVVVARTVLCHAKIIEIFQSVAVMCIYIGIEFFFILYLSL